MSLPFKGSDQTESWGEIGKEVVDRKLTTSLFAYYGPYEEPVLWMVPEKLCFDPL